MSAENIAAEELRQLRLGMLDCALQRAKDVPVHVLVVGSSTCPASAEGVHLSVTGAGTIPFPFLQSDGCKGWSL